MKTEDKARNLKDYGFSSFAGYTNVKKRKDFIHYNTVLNYFGGDSIKGRNAYRQFVYRGLIKGVENPLEIGKGKGIIGSDGTPLPVLQHHTALNRSFTREHRLQRCERFPKTAAFENGKRFFIKGYV